MSFGRLLETVTTALLPPISKTSDNKPVDSSGPSIPAQRINDMSAEVLSFKAMSSRVDSPTENHECRAMPSLHAGVSAVERFHQLIVPDV